MGPFQNTVRASATALANVLAVSGPMSRPFQPGSMPSAGTVRVSASSLTSRATTTSVGSSTGLPWLLAVSRSWRTASTWSGSNSESPISLPWAARKVKHMPPPTTRLSTRPRRLSSTASLSARSGSFFSSPGSYRRFWSSRTWPSPRAWAAWLAWSPATSSTNATSTPRCWARTGRTGSSEYLGSRWPLGRPRWEQQITLAPWSSSQRRVGTAARTRRSSVTLPSSRGTLKSLRTRTRRPATSAWSSVRSSTGLQLLTDQHGQVDKSLGVAPFVVVPAEHLGQVAVGLGQGRVEDAGGVVADDVAGHDRVGRVADDALQRALGGGPVGVVDLLDGGLAAEDHGQVGQGAVLHRDPQGDAVQLALELGDDQGGGLGRAGRGGDGVDGRRSGPAQVLVGEVEDDLVVGVGVDGGHEALLDPEAVEQDLGQGDHRVGRAGGVGDDVVAGRVVRLVVDPHHDGDVLVLGRGRDDDLPGPALEVQGGVVALGEAAGGLDDHVDAEVAPGQLGRVLLGAGQDPLAADGDRLVVVAQLAVEAAEGRVVLEQVGQGPVVGEVVDGDDLDVLALGGPEVVAADAAEAVDPDADGHGCLPGG